MGRRSESMRSVLGHLASARYSYWYIRWMNTQSALTRVAPEMESFFVQVDSLGKLLYFKPFV